MLKATVINRSVDNEPQSEKDSRSLFLVCLFVCFFQNHCKISAKFTSSWTLYSQESLWSIESSSPSFLKFNTSSDLPEMFTPPGFGENIHWRTLDDGKKEAEAR